MPHVFTATDVGFINNFQIADDGDPFTASAFNTPIEGAINNTKFLFDHGGMGTRTLVNTVIVQDASGVISNPLGAFNFAGATSVFNPQTNTPQHFGIVAGLLVGDLVELNFQMPIQFSKTAAPGSDAPGIYFSGKITTSVNSGPDTLLTQSLTTYMKVTDVTQIPVSFSDSIGINATVNVTTAGNINFGLVYQIGTQGPTLPNTHVWSVTPLGEFAGRINVFRTL